MTQKLKTTTTPEPEDDLTDPWDKPGFGEDELDDPDTIVLKATPVKTDEAQMNVAKENPGEWAVQYDDDVEGRMLHQHELRARIKREKFLQLLSNCGSLKKSAAAVKLTPRALLLARDKYPGFAKNWELAMDVYKQFHAEEVLHHRAIEGVLEPITYQGRVTGYKKSYDSGLAQFWYKHNMRDKYGDRQDINLNANINHGVILLPARGGDTASWEKQALQYHSQPKDKVIDLPAEVVEDVPKKTKVSR